MFGFHLHSILHMLAMYTSSTCPVMSVSLEKKVFGNNFFYACFLICLFFVVLKPLLNFYESDIEMRKGTFLCSIRS